MAQQVVSVNFGLLHQKVQFNYAINYKALEPALRQYHDVLAEFTEEDLYFLRWRMVWKSLAREKQLPPKEFEEYLKDIWVVRSGRGFGKTLCGANWLGIEAYSFPSMYCVIAPTKDDVRYTCFEGPTGLLAVIPPKLIADQNRSLPSITLKNGSIIRGFAGDSPERLRGPQHAKGWCDEIASWMYPEDAWSNLMFGLRLGPHPQLLVTGTPKPTPFIRDLVSRKDVVNVVGSTYENRENLTKSYFVNVAKYEGTKIGRQEIHGEVLDPEESGFVKRSQWKMWPADKPLPTFQYIVMSLDTAFTEDTHDKKKQENDPTACTVWGLFQWPPGPKGKKCIMLLDAWEEWLGFPDLIKTVKKLRKRRYGAHMEEPYLKPKFLPPGQRPAPRGKKVDLILIEEKGSGISLIQSLAVEDILAQPYNPGKLDKLARLHAASPAWAHGRVWAVESDRKAGEFRTWAEPVISQVCSYTGEGSLKRDDLLDTSTQAVRLFMDRFFGALTIVRDVEEDKRQTAREDLERKRAKERNPYDT